MLSPKKAMSVDFSGDDNSSYMTAATPSSSSRFADSFRSLDPPTTKSTSSPNYNFALDEFESSTVSARFYDECSYLDHSDFETYSDTQHLIMLHREQRTAAAQLKPPPARQSFGGETGKRSLTPSRRRSGLHVHRRSLWNDDFDPFTAALKNVREGEPGRKNRGGGNHRRVRSDSQFGEKGAGPDEVKPKPKLNWVQSMPRVRTESPIPSPSPMKSPQPKGVLYARHTRLVKMDTKQGEYDYDGEGIKACCNCHVGGSKREMLRNLMVSMKGRGEDEEEEEDVKKKESEPKMSRRKRLMRKLSFKSGRRDVDDGVSENGSDAIGMGKKLVQTRSNMLLCVGLKNKIYAS
ncbi:hypothetical protein LINGRAHAP2_LOCUS23599 [Linum grandiflorum]